MDALVIQVGDFNMLCLEAASNWEVLEYTLNNFALNRKTKMIVNFKEAS